MEKYLIVSVFIFNCASNPTNIPPQDLIALNVQAQQTNNNGTPVGNPPLIPIGVVAVPGNQQNTISWTTQNDATSFNIYFNTTGFVNFSNSTKFTSNINSFTHYGLTNGTIYYYVVTAVNPAGESTESIEVHAMAGLIDNHNGSIYVSSLNQTWQKCSDNYYNQFTDACNNPNLPTHIYCATDLYGACDNGTFLISGDAFNTCKTLNIGGRSTWRVPNVSELQSVYAVSSSNPNLFGVFQDWHWATNAMPFMQVSFVTGLSRQPTWRTQTAYIMCVSDGM